MTDIEFLSSLRACDPLFGTLIVSTSPVWPKVIQSIGLDYVFLDTEHIALDRSCLSWMCRTYRALGIPPIVRITSPDPYLVTVALDDAAAGVLVPYIESADQVRALVGAAKYRPLKGQKLQAVLNQQETVGGTLAEYLKKANAGNSLILNIESVPGMKNLDSILRVDGVDGIIIGPHDLSTSLEVPEQYDHPKFIAAVDEIIEKARAAGVSAGIHAGFNQQIHTAAQIRWMQRGANLILHAGDIIAFQQTMQRDIATLREGLGQSIAKDEVLVNI
ncbi:HpcH/HpaI aldolase family protein [Adhaeretor mobilis]|uniref:5-keto-4-deoxy-D-glucarate aldolase n=1 Tax=Adhaeretor mobilis TaxID=1930276 RepID=A0A517MVC4_9BACT|nr:aldolase/citrate lyase family protein [Adhaeretor mobilis]QDS98830.1 5-keto-4-deoxy-D-glucarate aldolase [Adhaeretor mobilis]